MSENQIEELLIKAGINFTDKGNYYLFYSPFRPTERTPSMVIYKNSGMCIDFGSSYRKHITKFAYDILGKGAYSIVDNMMKSRLGFRASAVPNRKEQIDERLGKDIEVKGESYADIFENPVTAKYCRDRHIDEEFVDIFSVRYCASKPFIVNGSYYFNRLLIPIVENGVVISMEARDYVGNQERKVQYPKNAFTSTLFNIDNLVREEPLVIVEGLMDVPIIFKYLTRNVTTVFGVNISRRQFELLREFKHIIAFPDGDLAGLNMLTSLDENLDIEFEAIFIEGADPKGIPPEELQRIYENSKIPITQFFLDQSGLFETEKLSWK